MARTLVCCGGTGAHVALSFMRLHALGHPLGYFGDESTGEPIELPAIYLVDQDHGDGALDKEMTAWQELRAIVDSHPSRHQWGTGPNQPRSPTLLPVTPLPLGPDDKFASPPQNRLGTRFDGSAHLDLVASPRQKGIDFALGMMGSPAMGSLLFRLKEFDLDTGGFNRDRRFAQILNRTGRIAVVGSGVGGTGSSVAPTLARMLADADGVEVMAIMVLQWFELEHTTPDTELATAQRNQDMRENASSGLQYYGRVLAEKVPTVPVGVPKDALAKRLYKGNVAQPSSEFYAHAVASLCCMQHYVTKMPLSAGLYCMSAANPGELGGGTYVPGGTIQSIADQGAALERTTHALGRFLEWHEKVGRYSPTICHEIARVTKDTTGVGGRLVALAKEYRKHLDWLYKTLGVDEPQSVTSSTGLKDVENLASSPPPLTSGSGPQHLAGELFQWTASWIRDRADSGGLIPPSSSKGAFFPPLADKDNGLPLPGGMPGRLIKVEPVNVPATLRGFVDVRHISQNGWPDPFASASHFHSAVGRADGVAMRQLELILAGLVEKRLVLKEIGRGTVDGLSVDRIVDDARRRAGRDLARYVVIKSGGREDGRVFGFSSPETLFCPAPMDSEDAWGSLWAELTGLDAETWRERKGWGSAKITVSRIVGWVNACKTWVFLDDPPAWTGIFSAENDLKPLPFGGKTTLEVDRDRSRKKISVFLPTDDPGDFLPKDHEASPSTKGAGSFLRAYGRVVDDADELLFEVVDNLRLPADQEAGVPLALSPRVRAIWKEHLSYLQARGVIVTFGQDRGKRQVFVVKYEKGGPRCILLDETVLLDRETIGITNVQPLLQDPIPGKAPGGVIGPARTLYPDLPLRSDYVDLVDYDKWNGNQPVIAPGGDKAEWRLPLRGRSEDLSITVLLPTSEPHKAHWMVWPAFRTASQDDSSGWRAYYAYEHCTHHGICLDILYHQPGDDGAVFRRRNRGDQRASYPVSYDPNLRQHTGGPPFAVSMRKWKEEYGIYMVQLAHRSARDASVSVGIDFGTSHSSAAVKVGDTEATELLLGSEMDGGEHSALSHHVSENWGHVTAPDKDMGLLKRSTWMPNYADGVESSLVNLVPTELLTHEPAKTISKDVDRWIPMQDYVIPPIGISRRNFPAHVIANFKWDTVNDFAGLEEELRRNYLDRLVELAVAEVLMKHGVPSQGMDLTFTYPLRTPEKLVETYQRLLKDILKRGTASLGTALSLTGGEGLFNESHAARVGMGKTNFGEVLVVGDLGGGTLDLLISAVGKPGVKFKEVVDSVKIGGNLLLRTLGMEMAGKMPSGWSTDGEELAAQLAAWMRAKGSPSLFGPHSGEKPSSKSLSLVGFRTNKDRWPGQQIIRRYFDLVGEYVARSVAAYLATHWFREAAAHHDKPCVQLYLRGNGWRLWFDDDHFLGIQAAVAHRVSSRIVKLWDQLVSEGLPIPPKSAKCESGGGDMDPKLDVVRNIVGDVQPDAAVWNEWLSYIMIKLTVLGSRGRIVHSWHTTSPFPTYGFNDTKVQFDEVQPPIPLSDGLVDDLGPGTLKALRKLENDAVYVGPDSDQLRAPVGAYVWEEAFKLIGKGAGKGSQR